MKSGTDTNFKHIIYYENIGLIFNEVCSAHSVDVNPCIQYMLAFIEYGRDSPLQVIQSMTTK